MMAGKKVWGIWDKKKEEWFSVLFYPVKKEAEYDVGEWAMNGKDWLEARPCYLPAPLCKKRKK